jgi:hypothetical protein
LEHAGRVLHFCRCPQCMEEFHRRPAFYVDRLERRTEYSGVFSEARDCCVKTFPSAVVLQSVIACPNCANRTQETMPTEACVFFYECSKCHAILRPKPGHCCVFCSYGSVPCPSIQIARRPV